MFNHISTEQQFLFALQRLIALEAKEIKQKADMEYLAMMSDIDLDDEEEEENAEE